MLEPIKPLLKLVSYSLQLCPGLPQPQLPVVCSGATAGFATACGCGPTQVLGFKPALSCSIRFGTTVGGRGAEV